MSESSNNYSTVEYCTVVLSFFFEDLPLVTHGASSNTTAKKERGNEVHAT